MDVSAVRTSIRLHRRLRGDRGVGTDGPGAPILMAEGMQRWNEADRLAALHSYAILDTPGRDAFADFVQIASEVCEAPIAVVNLVDEGRQWFAAEVGLGLGVRETPLDVSICAHAILQQDLFVVADLTKDSRFECNPLVVGDPKLRFYGGALLLTPEGLPLGTMCVLDYQPRPLGLTARQAFTLKALARQVMTQLELRRAVAERDLLVLEAHHRVKNSLQMLQALFLMQAKASEHPDAALQLRASARRVHTFAAMHELLYKVGATASVNLADYLRILLTNQNATLASFQDGRSIEFHGVTAMWPASDAPSIGLVLTELVMNALKHGKGTITVTLRHSRNQIELIVEDEGYALPLDYLSVAREGLGMRVVTGLLRGRQGRLHVDRARQHTRIIVSLKPPAAAAAPDDRAA